MGKVKLWFKALRAPFFTASVIPVLVGAALSRREGCFHFPALISALLVVISLHAGSNLINDYFDANGSDRINQQPTPFSGGSRFIQAGILSRASYLKAAMLAYGLGIITTITLAFSYQNSTILVLALIGAILGISYSAVYIRGMGRGWGELAIGAAFGPLAVLGSYLLQTNHLSWKAVAAGIPVGFLIMGVVLLNEFPDINADRAAGKRNWIVRVGGGVRGVWIYLIIISLAYLTILTGIFWGVFPVGILCSYSTLPLAIWILLKTWRYRDEVLEMIPVMAGNIGLHFLTGLLICLGLWW